MRNSIHRVRFRPVTNPAVLKKDTPHPAQELVRIRTIVLREKGGNALVHWQHDCDEERPSTTSPAQPSPHPGAGSQSRQCTVDIGIDTLVPDTALLSYARSQQQHTHRHVLHSRQRLVDRQPECLQVTTDTCISAQPQTVARLPIGQTCISNRSGSGTFFLCFSQKDRDAKQGTCLASKLPFHCFLLAQNTGPSTLIISPASISRALSSIIKPCMCCTQKRC